MSDSIRSLEFTVATINPNSKSPFFLGHPVCSRKPGGIISIITIMLTPHTEVEKVLERGNQVPRKFLRFAESFQANHMRDRIFCEICRIMLQYMGKRG